MKFFLKPTDPNKLEADALLVFCWQDKIDELNSLNRQLISHIKEAAEKEDFTGKADQFLSLSTQGTIASYKLILTGLGKRDDFSFYKLYLCLAKAIKETQKVKPAKVAIVIPDDWWQEFSVNVAIQAAVEAVSAASYKFSKYKSEEERKKTREIEEIILLLPAAKLAAAEAGLKSGEITSTATAFARDLINEPADVTTPAYLSQIALDLAKKAHGGVKVNILEKEQIAKLGMGAFLGVARGSDEMPKFIHLRYKAKCPKKKIVLVGKGITFDTGGLSLKNAEQMETMKMDMAGAAAVLAVFSVIPFLHPELEVVGLIPACENMPSGRAIKPGDIVTAMNGKTIEVLNTDAEGRLTLADALSYAVIREKPNEIIDLATLTGACMIALGQDVAGLWGNNDKFIARIEKSAHLSGEKVWRMPLEVGYKELLESHIADIKNVQTGKYGGAITAALFLAEFVGSTPWVHLDIAGPAYQEKDLPLVPKGGAGFAVRLLLHYLAKGAF